MKIRIHANKDELKGLSMDEQQALQQNPEPWPIDYVEVIDAPAVQHFTQVFLNKGMADGYIGISGGNITITAKPKDVVYKILRAPGAYCCHCGCSLSAGGQTGQSHVAADHAGVESPDPENPSGYRVDNFFACERKG